MCLMVSVYYRVTLLQQKSSELVRIFFCIIFFSEVACLSMHNVNDGARTALTGNRPKTYSHRIKIMIDEREFYC